MTIPSWLMGHPVINALANQQSVPAASNEFLSKPTTIPQTSNPKPVLPNPITLPKLPHKNSNSAPQAPTSALGKWLAGDTTYQDQLAQFNKSQSDYNSEYNTQVSQENRDYNETQRQLTQQGQQDRMDQQNDFAGRGILHSGVYAKALTDYNTQFNEKVQNLINGKTDQLNNLAQQRKEFLSQLKLQEDAAKQDAVRRRAEQLGI